MADDHDPQGHQLHFDPATYLAMVRAEVPAYDELQAVVARSAVAQPLARVLDLGVGTGETSAAVLVRCPDAQLVGVDESADMLAVAAHRLPDVDLRVGPLEGVLPEGPFDLVISALAVHHLDAAAKADLFARVAGVLRPEGCFVLADVVVPEDPADAITPLDGIHDTPSSLADQLGWLEAAGLQPTVVWMHHDLVVVVAGRR